MRALLQNRSAEDVEFIMRTRNTITKMTAQRDAELARLEQEDQRESASLSLSPKLLASFIIVLSFQFAWLRARKGIEKTTI